MTCDGGGFAVRTAIERRRSRRSRSPLPRSMVASRYRLVRGVYQGSARGRAEPGTGGTSLALFTMGAFSGTSASQVAGGWLVGAATWGTTFVIDAFIGVVGLSVVIHSADSSPESVERLDSSMLHLHVESVRLNRRSRGWLLWRRGVCDRRRGPSHLPGHAVLFERSRDPTLRRARSCR